jgi:hypothetical protein
MYFDGELVSDGCLALPASQVRLEPKLQALVNAKVPFAMREGIVSTVPGVKVPDISSVMGFTESEDYKAYSKTRTLYEGSELLRQFKSDEGLKIYIRERHVQASGMFLVYSNGHNNIAYATRVAVCTVIINSED